MICICVRIIFSSLFLSLSLSLSVSIFITILKFAFRVHNWWLQILFCTQHSTASTSGYAISVCRHLSITSLPRLLKLTNVIKLLLSTYVPASLHSLELRNIFLSLPPSLSHHSFSLYFFLMCCLLYSVIHFISIFVLYFYLFYLNILCMSVCVNACAVGPVEKYAIMCYQPIKPKMQQ